MALLDSSAWLAHLFGEPGVEQVNQLFDQEEAEVSISVLSIPEVYARLNALGHVDKWTDLWADYEGLFTRILAVNEEIAHEAVRLRSATPQCLPTIDAQIAATASVHRLPLVHRDPHMAGIPDHLLPKSCSPASNPP